MLEMSIVGCRLIITLPDLYRTSAPQANPSKHKTIGLMVGNYVCHFSVAGVTLTLTALEYL